MTSSTSKTATDLRARYRVSPFTYWVGAMASAMLHGRQVVCSNDETSVFQPPSGQTCGAYLQPYLNGGAPGYLQNPQATSDCRYCQIRVADTFLAGVGIEWTDRWRDFGLVWVYVFFNIGVTVFVYWFFRVRTSKKKTKTSSSHGKKNKGDNDEQSRKASVAESSSQDDEKVGKTDSEEPTPLANEARDHVPASPTSPQDVSRTRTSSSSARTRPSLVQRGLSSARGASQSYLNYNLRRVETNKRNAHVY